MIYLLLTSPSTLDGSRDRYHPKRIHSALTTPILSMNNPPKTESVRNDNGQRADEEQIKRFAELLYNRLNLIEPPNVTLDLNDGTGLPSSVVRQLELNTTDDQRLHRDEELRFGKLNDESQATTERAAVPGDRLSSSSCQRQLSSQLNISMKTIQLLQCFRFFRSLTALRPLPNDQVPKELKILVKKQFFIPDIPVSSMTTDMFQVYQIFRPENNGTAEKIFASLTGTQRLPVKDVKSIENNWIALTLGPFKSFDEIPRIYAQFMLPLFGLAINRQLQISHSHQPWHNYGRKMYPRRYPSTHMHFGSNDESSNEDKVMTPYMMIEYGKKLAKSYNRNRRAPINQQPAHCDSHSPCCRQQLNIYLDQNNSALNFIIYPRKIDIGQCVGLCGPSGSSLDYTQVKNSHINKDPSAAYNYILLHSNRNNHTSDANSNSAAGSSKTNCCGYSRTGGLEILYRTSNFGPIIRKYVPNIIVESCKCGLQAIIQEQIDKQHFKN